MKHKRRMQLTIAVLMVLVAASALLFVAISPLIRHGKPPCLDHGQTARWLLGNIGGADCNACHRGAPQSPPQQAVQALARVFQPPTAAHASLAADESCLKCHGAVR